MHTVFKSCSSSEDEGHCHPIKSIYARLTLIYEDAFSSQVLRKYMQRRQLDTLDKGGLRYI
jgi:hypothetical protein